MSITPGTNGSDPTYYERAPSNHASAFAHTSVMASACTRTCELRSTRHLRLGALTVSTSQLPVQTSWFVAAVSLSVGTRLALSLKTRTPSRGVPVRRSAAKSERRYSD